MRRRGLGLWTGAVGMTPAQTKTWFGQPRGLTILVLTGMWEMFSYFGMRTLLVYYMTKQLLFTQEKSSFIYGSYTAAAFFTPILGGIIADRWLGKTRAVIIGGSAMAMGHFLMTFEPLFYGALDLNADVSNGQCTVRIFARNVTDERAYETITPITNISGSVDHLAAVPIQPRIVGIEFDFRF